MGAGKARAIRFGPTLTLSPTTATLTYQTKQETVTGLGASLQIRSLLDRQQFSDPQGLAEAVGISSAQWPLFGLLWPSGHVLAHAMVVIEMQGKRILELGCGLGLASLVLHRRGGNVTASDNHPLAGAFLKENVRLNDLAVLKYVKGDWATPNAGLGLFDLIIGSDVLYDRGQPEALSQFVQRHAAQAVQVLIVDPDRGNHASFSRKMAVLGFSHAQARVKHLPGGASYKGQMHTYDRAGLAVC